jgi:hypothetical protein
VAAGEGDGGPGGGGDNNHILIDQTGARQIKCDRGGHAAGQTLSIQLRKCTYLGIGTSSPTKEIWLNPKHHLGGKFTARLSS